MRQTQQISDTLVFSHEIKYQYEYLHLNWSVKKFGPFQDDVLSANYQSWKLRNSHMSLWSITWYYRKLLDIMGDFASGRHSGIVCSYSHSDKTALCSPLPLFSPSSPPLLPPLPPLSRPLSSSWYSHTCNGINTLLCDEGRTETEEKQRGWGHGRNRAGAKMGEAEGEERGREREREREGCLNRKTNI